MRHRHAHRQKSLGTYKTVKRATDIVLALLGCVLLAALMIPIVAAIRMDSHGPAFYRQWRVGKGHKLFRLYKFRTMHIGAEQYAAFLKEEGEFFVQREDDPRVTRVGRWLRKISLDELPQMLNILMGTMSFIGPRPLVLFESNALPPIALRRLSVCPGLTGFAQVMGRKDADITTRIAHDVYYVEHISLSLDVRILLRTIEVVFFKDGAY